MSAAYKLTYRRENWDPSTAPKIKLFSSLGGALYFIREARKREGLQARLEERVRGGRWHEIAIPAVES